MFRNPTLTREIIDDHRKPLARYGAMMSALRKRLAPLQLHHSAGVRHAKLVSAYE
jgi:hypothetical protein